MRHILASLDSVLSAADRIKEKVLKSSCLRGDSSPNLSQQSGSTRLSGNFNPPAETSVLNPSTKQAHKFVPQGAPEDGIEPLPRASTVTQI